MFMLAFLPLMDEMWALWHFCRSLRSTVEDLKNIIAGAVSINVVQRCTEFSENHLHL